MADEYGFAITEEEFKAILDELLGKVPDEKTQQANARQALSEIIGIDLDKVAALIEDGAAEQTEEKTDEQPEQAETVTLESVLAPDMFGAEDPNGIYSVYWANQFEVGSVIAIGGVEFFKAVVPHEDHTHDMWINIRGRMFSDEEMAETARHANIDNNGEGDPATRIIHFG